MTPLLNPATQAWQNGYRVLINLHEIQWKSSMQFMEEAISRPKFRPNITA